MKTEATETAIETARRVEASGKDSPELAWLDACAITRVYGAISPKNQAAMEKLGLAEMARVAADMIARGETVVSEVTPLAEHRPPRALLLTHNPSSWFWADLDKRIEEVAQSGAAEMNWRCRSKDVQAGDRVFLLRQGAEPRGIFAAGRASAGTHVEEGTRMVPIRLDVLFNPCRQKIVARAALDEGALADVHWGTQTSGIGIAPDAAKQLESLWADLLSLHSAGRGSLSDPFPPDEPRNRPSLSVRDALENLDQQALIYLAEVRGLPGARSNEERRQKLIASYRGDVRTCLGDMRKTDLQVLLSDTWYFNERPYQLSGVFRRNRDELLRLAEGLFLTEDMPPEFTPAADEEADEESDEPVRPTRLLDGLTTDWSRPRDLSRILDLLGMEVPQRLRSERFQEVLAALRKWGVEMQYLDGGLAKRSDESPGITARVRLRLSKKETGEAPPIAPSMVATAPPTPPHEAPAETLPAFELGRLRLEFLTAAPSMSRESSSSWPGAFLSAAVRDLDLSAEQQKALAGEASAFSRGGHEPWEAADKLARHSPLSDWQRLLSVYRALNTEVPEFVNAVIACLAKTPNQARAERDPKRR